MMGLLVPLPATRGKGKEQTRGVRRCVVAGWEKGDVSSEMRPKEMQSLGS